MRDDFFIYVALILPILSSVISLITKNKIRLLVTLVLSMMTLFCCYNVYLRYLRIEGFFLIQNLARNFSVFIKPDLYGAIFAMLISFMWIPSILFSHVYMYYHCNKNEKTISEFFSYFSLAIFVSIAIAFSGNLLTLFIFYEVLTIVTYFLVSFDKTIEVMKASRLYIFTLMGSSIVFLMPAVIIVWLNKGTSLLFDENLKFIFTSYSSHLLLLLLFIYGFAKHALMPVHMWLPRAMIAPTPVSALLHAVAVVKSGIFCILKVSIYVFGFNSSIQSIKIGVVMQSISAFTIIVASLIALTKTQLKEVLAYSTISQLGYMLFVIGMMNQEAINATLLCMMLHSFAKITLFFTVGAIYIKTHKKYINEVHGLSRTMPLACIFFTIGAFGMIGLPLTGNNYGKAFIIGVAKGDMQTYFTIVVMGVSTMLNTLYFFPIVYKMFFCSSKEDNVCSYDKGQNHIMSVLMNASFIITGVMVVFLFFRIDLLENLIVKQLGF